MDSAAIFSNLCLRHQIRHPAGLPFDMKAEYGDAVAKAELARRRVLLEEHRAEVKAEILKPMRMRYGLGWPFDL